MSAKVKLRSYLSGLTVSFKDLPMEMTGDLVNIGKTRAGDEERFKLVSPTEPPQKVVQFYSTEDGQERWTYSQCLKGKELDDGTIVVVGNEELKAAKASLLPERLLQLEAFPVSEVETKMAPGKNSYVFRPKGTSSLYGVLQKLLTERTDLVFLGRVNMGARSGEKIVRFSHGPSGHLLVQELLWPEDVNEFDAATWTESSDKLYAMAEQLVEASIGEFVPEEWRKESRIRVQALVEAVAGGGSIELPERVQEPEMDLESTLEAMLAALKQKAS